MAVVLMNRDAAVGERKRISLHWVRFAPPAAVFVLAVAIWQIVCMSGHIPTYLLPSPLEVAGAASANAATLLAASWATFVDAFGGFGLSIVVGVAVAFVMSQAKWLERSLYPYAILLQTIPIIAIAPLIVIWLGSGNGAIVAISFLIAVFPIISNANFGLVSTDPNLVNLVRMYNRSRFVLAAKVRFPHALPQIFAGLKISAGLSVIGAIVGQFVAGIGGGNGGLGYLITQTAGNLQMPYLFAAGFASSVLGLFSFALVGGAASLCIGRWHDSARLPE